MGRCRQVRTLYEVPVYVSLNLLLLAGYNYQKQNESKLESLLSLNYK